MKSKRKFSADYIHSSFFGLEDSLVSTTGVLAGIAVAASSKEAILTTAFVVIAVESISMAASEFVSEETEEEVEKQKSPASPILSGLIIFVSYILAGLIPLAPYLFLEHSTAIVVSILAALMGLILLGVFKGKITHKNPVRSAVEVFIIGGVSAAIGIAAGLIFKV